MIRILDLRTLDPCTADAASLDAPLRAHIESFRRPEDRLRSTAAYLLAQQMLAEAGAAPPIVFSRTERGKPFVAGAPHFSLSHSGHFVACAVSDRPVGVDIEALRPLRDLTRRVCTEEEAAFVLENGFDSARFLQIWTAKEAVLKCTGQGLGGDLRRLSVYSGGRLSCRGFVLDSRQTAEYVVCTATLFSEPEAGSLV